MKLAVALALAAGVTVTAAHASEPFDVVICRTLKRPKAECDALAAQPRRDTSDFDRRMREAAERQAERDREAAERHEKAVRLRLSRIDAMTITEARKADLRKGKLWVGATAEMARLAWGEPKKVDTVTSAGGTAETWLYDRDLLRIENGVVAVIGQSR